MLAVLLVAKPRKANIDYITPITALCLVTILLYRSLNVADGHVAGSLMTAFLISFYVLLWLMFISEANERKLPASSCWAWPWASRGCRWRWGARGADAVGANRRRSAARARRIGVAAGGHVGAHVLQLPSLCVEAGCGRRCGAPEEAAGAPLAHLSAGDASCR